MARMSEERRARAIANMMSRAQAEKAKGSTAETFAISQKAVEAFCRDYWYEGGLRAEDDFRARTAGKADMKIRGLRAEIKTGGTVGIPATEDWSEADIMPDASWIVFPLMDEIAEPEDVPDNTVVMRRETFIEIAATCSRKGITGTFHMTSRQVLAFQPTPLRKLRERLMDSLLNGELPTLRTLKEEEGA